MSLCSVLCICTLLHLSYIVSTSLRFQRACCRIDEDVLLICPLWVPEGQAASDSALKVTDKKTMNMESSITQEEWSLT